MAGNGVPLREHVAALREADQRLADERHANLARRLDESARDREHICEALGGLVLRTEYDRTLGQALDRLSRLETTVARIYGGIAVVVLALSMLGIVLRLVLG